MLRQLKVFASYSTILECTPVEERNSNTNDKIPLYVCVSTATRNRYDNIEWKTI